MRGQMPPARAGFTIRGDWSELMRQTQSDQAGTLRRYLLGESSAEERSAVERQLMTDQEFLDALSTAEEDLIDEYASGKLDGQEKRQFESLFLTAPERREEVAFAQALNHYISEQTVRPAHPVSHSHWRTAAVALLAAAVVLLTVSSAVLYMRIAGIRQQLAASEQQRSAAEGNRQLTETQLAQQQQENEELRQQLADASRQPPVAPDLIALNLASGWNRGSANTPSVVLPLGKRLRLNLGLSHGASQHGYRSYSVKLQTVDGKPVWSGSAHASPRSVAVTIPASTVPPNDYLVILNGTTPQGTNEEVASYYFRVNPR